MLILSVKGSKFNIETMSKKTTHRPFVGDIIPCEEASPSGSISVWFIVVLRRANKLSDHFRCVSQEEKFSLGASIPSFPPIDSLELFFKFLHIAVRVIDIVSDSSLQGRT